MAVNREQHFDSELPEGADMMLFAEDLVDYLLLQTCLNYIVEWEPITFRDHIYNAFVKIIGSAIHFIDKTLERVHIYLFREMKNANFVNSESYEKFAETLAAEYFSEGFDAKYFLIYCVNLSIMAANFYCDGIVYAADLAKMHIYQILQEYDVSAGGWDAILRMAENYGKCLRDSENELAPPEISVLLYEIEDQDLNQETASDESKFPLNGKQSILSKNAESNIETQKELACSEIKIYMKKYAQYSSKSKSEVGLRLVKESKSSGDTSPKIILEGNKRINRSKSDNEPTPGTSNVDQGLILIITDFKKQIDLLWNDIMCGN